MKSMPDKESLISRQDIEKKFTELKEETDEFSGPSVLSRRIFAVGGAILALLMVYYAGKRRGERTKTFVEVIRAE